MTDTFLPFALPDIGEEEISAVVACLRSGWLTTGPKAQEFESQFAAFVGVKHALAVNSCTAALHLALEACGVGPGDRVITTPFTFTATAQVIVYLGAEPVFADIDAETLNIAVGEVQRRLDEFDRVKAIIPVHFAGLACDMPALLRLARDHDLRVIEDAAHALPCTLDSRSVGSFGDAGAFSFYATKTLCTGEGGMVTTNNDRLAEWIKTMRLHGINRDVFDRYQSEKANWYYEVVAPGYKYNMPDTAAALGVAQLHRALQLHERRRSIAHHYTERFADLPIECPADATHGDAHAWHLYVIRLASDTIDRNEFIWKMASLGIGTSVHFIPLHLQPYWRDSYHLRPDDFPVAHDVYQRCVSLPIYSRMSDADVERTVKAVRRVLGA